MATTVKFFSTDKAGNKEAPNSTTIKFDTTVPTTNGKCNGANCSVAWYTTTPVSVTLSASDQGGSGLSAIYFTVDGTTPTTASTVYTLPIALGQTTTVQWFAIDNAGNRSAVKSVTVKIDTAQPTVSITVPVDGSSIKAGIKVSISASALDFGTGAGAASGVQSVRFSVDGTPLSTDKNSPFTATWSTLKSPRPPHDHGGRDRRGRQQLALVVDHRLPHEVVGAGTAARGFDG